MSRAKEMGRLIFGKPSLSRMWCGRCDEDTIHRNGRCIHCRRLHRETTWSSRPYGRRT